MCLHSKVWVEQETLFHAHSEKQVPVVRPAHSKTWFQVMPKMVMPSKQEASSNAVLEQLLGLVGVGWGPCRDGAWVGQCGSLVGAFSSSKPTRRMRQ